MKDFFISYNRHDKQWAEWIAWTLEEAAYTVAIEAWDFRPGGNFVLYMDTAAGKRNRRSRCCRRTFSKQTMSTLSGLPPLRKTHKARSAT